MISHQKQQKNIYWWLRNISHLYLNIEILKREKGDYLTDMKHLIFNYSFFFFFFWNNLYSPELLIMYKIEFTCHTLNEHETGARKTKYICNKLSQFQIIFVVGSHAVGCVAYVCVCF